jgi:hypothetical protein
VVISAFDNSLKNDNELSIQVNRPQLITDPHPNPFVSTTRRLRVPDPTERVIGHVHNVAAPLNI